MRRIELVVMGALVVVVGCASTRREERAAQPLDVARARLPFDAGSRAVPPRVHHLDVSPELPASKLSRALAARAHQIGVQAPVAFVWGDVSPPPMGASPAEIRSNGVSVPGWLVGSAHEIDMGQLAPEIHNVVLVSAERDRLYGSHPSGPGRVALDLEPHDAQSAERSRELFAFVSAEPGDVGPDAKTGDVLALFARLPKAVRYAVMPLPE